jgi:CRP/FNR family cyclic AMP-dependent transcriptional regulator
MSLLERPEFSDLLSRRRMVTPGEVIFLEGQEADAVYVILSGEVQAALTDSNGKQIVINRMHPGEIFGEMELLGPDSKRTATVLSEGGCELIVIDKAVVDKRLASADPFLRYMMGHLCGIIKVWTDLARRT